MGLDKQKKKNGKTTVQRSGILKQLASMSNHPTAEEVYYLLKKELPNIGLCTVYRNLENFSERGLVTKIKGKPVRYDGNTTPHNHIKCGKCGRVDDLFEHISIDMDEIKSLGYKLQDHKVEINGVCSKCHKKQKLEVDNHV